MKEKRKTILFNFFALFLCLVPLIGSILYKNVIAILLISTVVCFWIFGLSMTIKYVHKIRKNIKNGNFTIKEDEIASINDASKFKETNSIISLKFKNYKRKIDVSKKEYNNVKVGDKYYLVFIDEYYNGPIMYDSKNSVIEK